MPQRLATTGAVQGITIVLDSDPEVYRLSYGVQATLKTLEALSSKKAAVNLRLQEGIRIGLVVSDDRTMVFSPTPRMIEAGATTVVRASLSWRAVQRACCPVERQSRYARGQAIGQDAVAASRRGEPLAHVVTDRVCLVADRREDWKCVPLLPCTQ